MKLSARVSEGLPSPNERLSTALVGAKNKGLNIFNLSMGQPDVHTPKAFFDAINTYCPNVLGYVPATGTAEFLSSVISLFSGLDAMVEADNILPVQGASEAIQIVCNCLLDAGDELLIPEPFYPTYKHFVSMSGAVINPITTFASDRFAFPDEDAILASITPKTRAILLTNPDNPSGRVLSSDNIEMIIKIACDRDLWVISNEMYREFTFSPCIRGSLAQYPELNDRLIVIDSLSKQFSVCGARIGYLMSRNSDFMKQARKLCAGRLCVSAQSQAGAAALYNMDLSFFDSVRDIFVERRDFALKALSTIPGSICLPPNGSFYLMAHLPVDDTELLQYFLLEHFSDNGDTVLFTPGQSFYTTPLQGKQQARLALVYPQEQLKRAFEVLARGIEAYQKR